MAKIVREYNYDVAVIGGGTAGTACAIVCGENGLRTVVAEKGSSLGGSQVSGLVCPFMSHHIKGMGDEPFPPILKRLVNKLREKFPDCSANGGIRPGEGAAGGPPAVQWCKPLDYHSPVYYLLYRAAPVRGF